MPPKRRRTTEPSADDPPPKAVRRSTRISNSVNQQGNGNGIPQQADGYDESRAAQAQAQTLGQTQTQAQAQTGDMRGSREMFERTMKELGEMSLRLQRAVKKQRLAVETSDLSRCQSGSPYEMAWQPRPAPRGRASAQYAPREELPAAEQKPVAVKVESDEDLTEGAEEKPETENDEKSATRPPPVNCDKLPLPWKGRLGYVREKLLHHSTVGFLSKANLSSQACLNTYLRSANPPVFSSRTCRISSIVDHRHPLQDPTQPEHPTKNRPDKTKPPDVQLGNKFLQDLGLTNARDIVKMLRWNDKYGIKFMRLSSEMFPFASHAEHGYKLAPFAADVLAEAGKVAAELGHRLTTHPGQYTHIASPRKEVIEAAIRDLEYHDEMLSLLKLPEQQDRDAVMILHMGGTYGDKAATLDRFRENYGKLSDGVKRRLVLENDDVSWSVHDLLPICEELNIPLVLDFHHHNIVFDPSIREGTLDIMSFYDRISKTWTRKAIRQKMHYSEPTAGAITPRDRRKHSARVKTLPPCDPAMDLMIEAKDKEQAVFELMRTFRLPGWDVFNDIVPCEREDEPKKQASRKSNKGKQSSDDSSEEGAEKTIRPEDFGMGGPQNRVYWPEGMEQWLRSRKKDANKGKTTIDDD